MPKPRTPHTRTGNCWMPDVIYDCDECSEGELCDVCHEHDEPRGDCEDCAECEPCDYDGEDGS